jgi:hypothetical protein
MKYDPLYFNIFIICVYALNTANWAWQRNWPQALCWFAAALITVAVTWGLVSK